MPSIKRDNKVFFALSLLKDKSGDRLFMMIGLVAVTPNSACSFDLHQVLFYCFWEKSFKIFLYVQ